MSDHTIRRLTVGDIEDFVSLRGRMFREVGFNDIGDLDAVSADYFAQAIPSQEFVGFIALSGEAVVGSAGLSTYKMPPKPTRFDGRFGYISSMYVVQEHRRKGLGKRLLDALLNHAKSEGLTWVTLHASPMAKPIYEAAGFEDWNEMGLLLPQ